MAFTSLPLISSFECIYDALTHCIHVVTEQIILTDSQDGQIRHYLLLDFLRDYETSCYVLMVLRNRIHRPLKRTILAHFVINMIWE